MANESRDPTGGRFVDGKMTSNYGGEDEAGGKAIERTVQIPLENPSAR